MTPVIPVICRANAGYLLRHPWQLALAVLGILIGVAVIVAVDVANQSARAAFLLSMDAVTGKATHQIVGGPQGVDENLYTELRVEHGFRSVAPVADGYVSVAESSLQLLGVDLFAEREMRSYSLDVGSGGSDDGLRTLLPEFLVEPGAVLMSRGTAAGLGLAPGDRFEVEVGGRRYPASLHGVFAADSSPGFDNLLIADIATAQVWLNRPGRLSRIDVRLTDKDEHARQRLERMLPADTTLLTAAGRTRSAAEMSAAFTTNLTAMSLLALLVGFFLIYNSVSFSVMQRRRLIGILRALGVTRRQSFALILTEAASIGLIAAALGVLVGIWLGEQLLALVSQSINDFYFRVNVTGIAVDPLSIGKGMAAGVGASLLAAAVPAIEAAGYRPQLALTRSVIERRTRRLLPALAIAGTAVALLALLVLQYSGKNLVAGLSAVFMLIFGFALCVPAAVKALTSALEPLAASLGGVPARMAVAGIGSSLSRTGVAIVALSVAVSATIGVSVMVDSFRGSVGEWLENSLQADIYVGVRQGTLDNGLIGDLVRVPGVEAYSTSRRAWLESESGRTRILAIRMAPGSYAGTEILDAEPRDVVWQVFENDDAVLVSEPYAYQHAVVPGDSVTLRTQTGDRPFRIAATYQSYDINANALLMSRAVYDRHWSDPAIDAIGLYLEPGVDVDGLIAQLQSASRDKQNIVIRSNARIRELSLEIFDRTFIITDVLYWLALGVAFVGILAAMLALQLERARELAVLRALGMTPAQLGGMLTLQTGVIGLFSGLAAIPLGTVMAYVLIDVINRRAFGWKIGMSVDPETLLAALMYAIAAALLAGIFPAWRAAGSQPALAMREE